MSYSRFRADMSSITLFKSLRRVRPVALNPPNYTHRQLRSIYNNKLFLTVFSSAFGMEQPQRPAFLTQYCCERGLRK